MKKLLALLAAVLVLASCSASGGEKVSTTSDTKTEKTTTTEKGSDPDPDPDPTTTTEGDPDPDPDPTTTEGTGGDGDIEVTDVGFTAYLDYDDKPSATAGAELSNGGDDVIANFEVIFTFRDKDDKVVGTETSYVYAIGAGEVAFAEVDSVSLQGEAVKVEATSVVDPTASEYYEGTVLPVTITGVTQDEYSGPTVAGTAANPGDEVIEGGYVTCVLTTNGGQIVGGTSSYLDTLVPGGEVAWETYGSDLAVKATKARCAGASYA